ncbi:hypothetical protein [Roseococcus pinisoli]|uniref:Uncharacterized protein n=1 Tax=Roseococcus pinisoli TaxID=2835040 RepID=A0ABS5QFW7_9PROT|nr:hypothetical protein [Roseococcus pinisoli]MBS7812273.1 hypothetical protein [Roseococcus pinisoli]
MTTIAVGMKVKLHDSQVKVFKSFAGWQGEVVGPPGVKGEVEVVWTHPTRDSVHLSRWKPEHLVPA